MNPDDLSTAIARAVAVMNPDALSNAIAGLIADMIISATNQALAGLVAQAILDGNPERYSFDIGDTVYVLAYPDPRQVTDRWISNTGDEWYQVDVGDAGKWILSVDDLSPDPADSI